MVNECTKFGAGLPLVTYPCSRVKSLDCSSIWLQSGSLALRPLVINFENEEDSKSKLEFGTPQNWN